jgi:hypothetical protein
MVNIIKIYVTCGPLKTVLHSLDTGIIFIAALRVFRNQSPSSSYLCTSQTDGTQYWGEISYALFSHKLSFANSIVLDAYNVSWHVKHNEEFPDSYASSFTKIEKS